MNRFELFHKYFIKLIASLSILGGKTSLFLKFDIFFAHKIKVSAVSVWEREKERERD